MTTAPPETARRADPTSAEPAEGTRRRPWLPLLVTLVLLVWLSVAAAVHLTQGTAALSVADLWAVLTGGESLDTAAAVVTASRVPRLLAAVLVGCALGIAGASMQAVARNPLAAPDTTGVNAGAHLAVTLAAVLGAQLGAVPSIAVAFCGGLAAAAVVMGLSGGGAASPVRLVLAGSAITLGLSSITSAVLLLFPWETQGLFAWGAGSLGQNGVGAVRGVLLFALPVAVALILMARRLDLLQLGDDAARSLGVHVGRTRAVIVVLAVLLATSVVTVTGPIGFVGLCAPLLVRLVASRVPGLRRHRTLLPLAALAGTALVLTADIALRATFGSVSGVTVPTGVVTSVIGAVALILLATRTRSTLEPDTLITMRGGTGFGRRHPGAVLAVAGAVLVGSVVAGVLLGDSTVLLGDLWNWATGRAALILEIVLDSRVPRVLAALLAGACLGLAGALVQTVTRNPLADPGILGVSSAGSLGAVIVIVAAGAPAFVLVLGGSLAGCALAGLLIFALSSRGGINQGRMVLVGIAIWAGTSAVTTLLLVRTDPWNQNKALTWLGGSTFGARPVELLPMVVALLVAAVVVARSHRDLDIVQIDDTTPRVLGVRLDASRVTHVGLAVLLTGAATSTIGPIAFVGLVAPHAARILVGKRHLHQLPLTVLLGAALVVIADVVGRTALAPAQLPAGLTTAVVGTPYFLWLLWRMRAGRGRG
ncbi:iron ABC transporter permease [Actinoalloteichus caeruleus]|uniref:iron ABC transporter permease n=1 Tax=Actinoalloteichus cyanogriseus TaxID=2893586 RepID=UPI0004AA91A1|nr:iron ABC transporter permease [Actinoalloteichus caeruleus]